MARQRFVKPAFFKHQDLYSAEKSSGLPLRLAYEGLWCQADRRGIFRWKPTELKLDILPYDDIDFEACLTALEKAGFIARYVVEGKAYGIIPSLKDHQSFHKYEKASADPDPPPVKARAKTVARRAKHGACTPTAVAVTTAVTVTPPSRVRREDYREDVSPNGPPPPGFVEPTPEELADLERRKAVAKAKVLAARDARLAAEAGG